MGSSHVIVNIAEAQLVLCNEGNMCIVAMRDDVAPPGSKAISRMKGFCRNLRGPTVADRLSEVSSEGELKLLGISGRKSDRPIISMKSSKVTR